MARSPLLPLPDYQRIYQITYSVLEASEIAITHRACIFFASVGALILRDQYSLPATISAGCMALMVDEQGAVTGRYDKEYLLAFGEYIPFGDTFPILYQWSPNSSRFSPGASFDPLPLGDHKISALICYEDILPGFVNRMVRHADPDLLVNLTNDAWFGDSTEPWIHFALAKLRAVEHRRLLGVAQPPAQQRPQAPIWQACRSKCARHSASVWCATR